MFDLKKTLSDLGVIVKEDGTVEHTPVETVPIPKPATVTPVRVSVSQYASASVDNALLTKLMDEVNQDAPGDYKSFQEMLVKMLNVPGMTPVARYQAAAMAVNMTKAKVDQAVDALLKRLSLEETEYQQILDESTQEKVGTRQEEVKKLNEVSEANKKNIQSLEESNRGIVVSIAKLEGEIATNTVNLQRAADTFKATVEHARAQIETARQEAGQYLGESK